MNSLTIGELAKQCGVNIETIRYYERRGLLPLPPRSASGYRVFPADAVRRLRFIKQAQGLGFSLKDIEELLALRIARGSTHAVVQKRAAAKIACIDEKMRMLRRMKKALMRLTDTCFSGRRSASDCPILESLTPAHADK